MMDRNVSEEPTDEIVFAEEDGIGPVNNAIAKRPWKLIIVDDEEEVHDVTRLALNGFTFADRPLEFLSAFSGEEARSVLAEHSDAAVVLLDVVMETEHAGLDVAKYLREELHNTSIRIILRTGQPGQAPERAVITNYDINDYKEKTELTSQKLYTLMYAALRSFRDITALESSRRGLEKIIHASSHIFEQRSMAQFSQGVLEQITSLLHLDDGAAYLASGGVAAANEDGCLNILAGTGEFAGLVGQDGRKVLRREVLDRVEDALRSRKTKLSDGRYTGYFSTNTGAENVIYVSGVNEQGDVDHRLVDIFGHNVGVAFDNIYLRDELEETQREIVYCLSEAVETRSRETGYHVKRVAEYSKLLALGYGMSEEEAEIVKLAAPLHDVGKVGIPDAILGKPGKLTAEEWEIMKTHAELGYDMLKSSSRRILQAGAVIAKEHHEKWAGGGYPEGKSGEDIHIYGRIVALAEVFDALGSDRCYKKAWPMDEILDLVRDERGKHFDPKLVDIFLDNLDEVEAIRAAFPDAPALAA